MENITALTLGELLSSTDDQVRRNATSILKRLQRAMEPPPDSRALFRIYDNGGKTVDRYTAFHPVMGAGCYVTFSERPTHPQGFYQHGHGATVEKLPGDTRVPFEALPEECQRQLLEELKEE